MSRTEVRSIHQLMDYVDSLKNWTEKDLLNVIDELPKPLARLRTIPLSKTNRLAWVNISRKHDIESRLSPSVKHVLGPVSLTEHRLGKRQIYIFGDVHDRGPNCSKKPFMHIQDFIDRTILENKDKVIDVFIESEYETKDVVRAKEDIEYQDSYLSDLKRHYAHCLTANKAACVIGQTNARIHYTDVRSFKPFTLLADLRAMAVYLTLLGTEIQSLENSTIQKLIVAFNRKYTKVFLLNEKNNRFANYVQSPEANRIYKQWQHIKEKNIRDALWNYFTTKTDQHWNTIVGQHRAHHLTLRKVKRSLNYVYLILSLILQYAMFFMDFYLVSRLLRSFRPGSPTPLHSIIYVGQEHAENYRHILTNVLGATGVNSVTSVGKCLDIRTFKQPFFS